MFLCNYLKIIHILQVFLKKEEERKRRGTKLSLKTTIGAIELKKAIEKKKKNSFNFLQFTNTR